jgi:hypothetical protein
MYVCISVNLCIYCRYIYTHTNTVRLLSAQVWLHRLIKFSILPECNSPEAVYPPSGFFTLETGVEKQALKYGKL